MKLINKDLKYFCFLFSMKENERKRLIMAKSCAICGKIANKANKISFSHKANAHRQEPNLQSVKAVIDGKMAPRCSLYAGILYFIHVLSQDT